MSSYGKFWVRHLGVNAPMTYGQYVVSDAWRWFRADWMRRHGTYCKRCGRAGLDLHHVSYARLGRERDDDVVLLCRQCHEAFHMENGVRLSRTDKFCRNGARMDGNRQRLKCRKVKRKKPAGKPFEMPSRELLDREACGRDAVLWQDRTFVRREIDGSTRWVMLVVDE